MLRKCLRWMGRHWKLTICLFLAALLVLFNIIAFNHAYAMTHFNDGGTRTATPEALSWLQKVQVLFLGITIPRPVNHADPGSQGLSFETWWLQGKDGIKLEAWHIPHADARGLVVLLHGYASCKASLLAEARAFHDLGYATLLLDLRGSGGSDGMVTTIGVSEADDVGMVVKALRLSHPDQPLILYGQSMGSVAILRAIAEHRVQPQAVIVECPFDRLIATVENRFAAMGLPSFPGAPLLVFWGGMQHGFNGFRHNPVDYAREVRCPILLMHGENDPRVTQAQAEAIFESLAGAKRFEVFREVGHQSYLQAHPERWRHCVAGFLAEQATLCQGVSGGGE